MFPWLSWVCVCVCVCEAAASAITAESTSHCFGAVHGAELDSEDNSYSIHRQATDYIPTSLPPHKHTHTSMHTRQCIDTHMSTYAI